MSATMMSRIAIATGVTRSSGVTPKSMLDSTLVESAAATAPPDDSRGNRCHAMSEHVEENLPARCSQRDADTDLLSMESSSWCGHTTSIGNRVSVCSLHGLDNLISDGIVCAHASREAENSAS